MTLTGALEIIALVAIVVLAIYLVWVLTEFRRALGSVDRLARHLDDELIPLTRHATKTLDDIDEELGRVHGILGDVEDVSHRVSQTADLARHVLSSPLVKLAGWRAGMKKAVSTLAQERPEADGLDEPEQGSEAGGSK